MANNKDVSDSSRSTSLYPFDTRVNVILLIMFLVVVAIIALKGCGVCALKMNHFGGEDACPCIEKAVMNDNVQRDSLSYVK